MSPCFNTYIFLFFYLSCKSYHDFNIYISYRGQYMIIFIFHDIYPPRIISYHDFNIYITHSVYDDFYIA